MSRRLATASLCIAIMVGGCSTGAPGPTDPTGTPGPDDVAIQAKDMQFVQRDVRTRAGNPFAIWFDNRDGAPHNISIRDAGGASVIKGDLFSGPGIRVYPVAALRPGSYSFLCDLHPNMTGTITAT